MRSAKTWLFGTFLVAMLAGTALLFTTTSSSTAAPERERAANRNWRYHDGHWSMYDDGDKRWYYTNGEHWFYNTGNEGDAWTVYRFDKGFGRDGFERGDYKIPEERAKIEVPRHGVYHEKK
jgi:hypothetical protein